MSRAFVKEDDQEEPPFIPPRAPLQAGAINYVTRTGLKLLHQEKELLESDKEKAYQLEDEYTRRREIATIQGKLKLLEERINSARLLNPQNLPSNEIRFGAKIRIKIDGKLQEFQLVGVDEANVKEGKIAFSAPISIAITGSKVGDKKEFRLGKEVKKIEILSINY